ncbi:translesion DNA synthesis-associated protein ImuA [Pseudazoarcus pumilus]|uniref:SOS cell division inhibitor SulA n=1 Tax=Pseudazoarcus pumilus TaxID=2067960 RepID=A0A2I6S6E6_9RHOO|nr:translesion DNA synthesis-associated protein ImuA [Pseudazoarcus pumilus]AUN94835.1 SOS cell division inhibitor SulA [Pseudazoarcus pumilus]
MSASPALAALPPGLVWRADRLARDVTPGEPTGFKALDDELPGAGWPREGIVELLVATPGIGEIELLLPLLARAGVDRLVVWVAPPRLPYAPSLAHSGVPLERMPVVVAQNAAAAIWATRQALASGACHAVLAWIERIDMAALRRLQLAAEEAATPLFLYRPPQAARQSSPAVLRLALAGHRAGLHVDILKRRGPPASAPLILPLTRSIGEPAHAVDRPASARAVPAGIHARHG